MNGDEDKQQKIQLDQRIENINREIVEIRKELEKKEDKVDQKKKYLTWLIVGIIIISFYASYYLYIRSIF